ncbi:MAG: hypothetical protein HC850_14680 [Rhodomicrobium sp.]|nr:hypothetical protein [Rhodomicrobium sp.]
MKIINLSYARTSLGNGPSADASGRDEEAALDAYFANPIREKFMREGAAFADAMRSERSWGAGEWDTKK